MNQIKFKAFCKVTINQRVTKPREENDKSIQEKEEDEVLAKKLHDEQEKIVNEEVEKIKKGTNGKAGHIWEVRKRVLGCKNKNIVPRAITNPKSGKKEVNRNDIKEVTLKYCMETLANNHPDKEYEEEINNKKE